MKTCYLSFALLVCVLSTCLHARSVREISYDHETDILTLDLEEVYLIDILKLLSSEIGFELDIENVTTRRRVDFSGSGSSHDMVRRLMGSDSAVLSRDKTAPFRLKDVILLPDGDEDSSYLPAESSERVPGADGNAEQDMQRMELEFHNIEQRAQMNEPQDRGDGENDADLDAAINGEQQAEGIDTGIRE